MRRVYIGAALLAFALFVLLPCTVGVGFLLWDYLSYHDAEVPKAHKIAGSPPGAIQAAPAKDAEK